MKKIIFRINLFFIPAFFPVSLHLFAQPVTIVKQDFDTIYSPAWSYTGTANYASGLSSANDAPSNSPFGINGSWAWETTGQGSAVTLSFSNQNITGLDSVYIIFRVAAFSMGTLSNGPDDLVYVIASVSVNGGINYYDRIRINGAVSNNSNWAYSATGVGTDTFSITAPMKIYQPSNSGPATTDGYSTAVIFIPNTYSQVALNIRARAKAQTRNGGV